MSHDPDETRSVAPPTATFDPALEAGLAAAFGPDLTPGGWSLPPLLRDDPSEHPPVVRPSSPDMPRGPTDRYQLLGEIARGGMGVVFKGRDPDLGRDLAVKVLRSELASQPGAVRRFVEEAQVCGQLQHPGIVPVYDLGRLADGRPYFAMRLVRGRTLAALLAERKDPCPSEAGGLSTPGRGQFLQIFLQLCQAVAYAHAVGVVHRDLKPSNVMVGSFGEVQVMDWGLAKVLPRGGIADEINAASEGTQPVEDTSAIHTVRSGGGSETVAGSVMGTPAFMSPEQASGEVEKLDERADVFGLGAILCVILTGRPPFAGPTPEATRQMAIRGELGDADARLASCGADAEVADLCRRCVSADRDVRPRHAGEVARAVAAYLAEVEGRAHRAEVARAAAEARAEEEANTRRVAEEKAVEERKRRRVQSALTAVVGLMLLGVVAGQWWQEAERSARVESVARQTADEESARAEAFKSQAEAKSARAEDALARALEMRREIDRALREERGVWVVAFSPDGTHLATASGDAGARVWRTFPLRDNEDRNGVVAALQEAVLLNPADADARINLGVALQQKGDLEGAIAAYRQAIRLDPKFAPAHNNLGAALQDRGDFAGALAAYQEAIRLDPESAPAHANLGVALRARGDQNGAVVALREAVRLNPGGADALLNLGVALQQSGDLTGAIRAYQEILRLDPSVATRAQLQLGSALSAKGELAGAIAAYRSVLRVEPGNASVHATLGELLLRKGDTAGARAALAEAARLDRRWEAKLGQLPPVAVAPPPRLVRD